MPANQPLDRCCFNCLVSFAAPIVAKSSAATHPIDNARVTRLRMAKGQRLTAQDWRQILSFQLSNSKSI
jgi:hypothetical protein